LVLNASPIADIYNSPLTTLIVLAAASLDPLTTLRNRTPAITSVFSAMYRDAATVTAYSVEPLYKAKKLSPSVEAWNLNSVPVSVDGVLSASTVLPPSMVIAVDTVPLDAIVTVPVNERFLANS
jgi:hypothetical protein